MTQSLTYLGIYLSVLLSYLEFHFMKKKLFILILFIKGAVCKIVAKTGTAITFK